jgi:ADP-dependent NAD(P)H-hydrate dehydratase / NAD(P)H-hydrate epimerase
MFVVTAAQMQEMDRRTIQEFGIPGRVLMECAGRGATRIFLNRLYSRGPGRVGILAGRGNNGGDGFVMARYLAQRNIETTVFLLADAAAVQGDAAANLQLLAASGTPVIQITDEQAFADRRKDLMHQHYWIDALLGTGLKSEVKGFYRRVIEFINASHRPVLAVDIPSGLNADTGQPCGTCIQATATATFGFAKIGHVVYPGAAYCGPVEVIDIGIPPTMVQSASVHQQLIQGTTIRSILGRRAADSHKGNTGHMLVIAGSTGKTGAAAMCAASALRAGAGLVTLGVPESLNPILESLVVEAMTLPLPDRGTGLLLEEAFDAIVQAAVAKQSLALGPGLGTASHTRNLTARIIREIDLPMVIDADGLNNLAGHTGGLKIRKNATVLTPHPGEMARLTGLSTLEIQKDRLAAVRHLAGETGTHVVLKGARTVVAEPDGRVWINPTGNPGMAAGGMGDVLTGLIAGLLAQGCPASEACRAGVYLHGLAADMLAQKMSRGFLATEVMRKVPLAIQQVLDDPRMEAPMFELSEMVSR